MHETRETIPLFPRGQGRAASAGTVLIVSADEAAQREFASRVHECGFSAQSAATLDEARSLLQGALIDVCLVVGPAARDGLAQFAGYLAQRGLSTQLICSVESRDAAAATAAPAIVGVDYLQEPSGPTHLATLLYFAAQRARLLEENRRLKRQLSNRTLRDMVGQSPAMQTLRQHVREAADVDDALLLLGAPGSGIDLVARAVHDASRRAHRPLIKVDCSVLSAVSLERELFGAAPESPLSRAPENLGWLQLADGGTLFLDAVDAVALPLQKKLVQVFTSKRFARPGSQESVRFDVRIVAGSHADLKQLIAEGLFRSDLDECLRQKLIVLPTLRERLEDIGLLAQDFLRQLATREGKPARSITLEALRLLQSHPWPGNVRELENVLDRACSIDWGTKLTAEMLEPWLAADASDDAAEAVPGLTLKEMERKLIETTFIRFGGNREKTAKALHIGIRTLCGKLRDYGYPPRGGPGSNQAPSQLRAA